MVVTRFAPSPTGYLHLGHAFAAVTAARSAGAGGRFLLRIENIDQTRSRRAFEDAILDDLIWLGLSFEMPVRRQSEHFADYRAALARLEDRSVLYPCFCTRKEIAAEIARSGEAPHLAADHGDGPIYPGTCRAIDEATRQKRIGDGATYAMRLDWAKAYASVGRNLRFSEYGAGPKGERGTQVVIAELFGDVVLARKDVPVSYHLAVVVDDALQGVDLVTRGNVLFAATHVQRLLQELLDLPTPSYAHHRLVLAPDGKKFSKRDGAVTLKSLRESGQTPDDVFQAVGLGPPPAG